MLSTAASILIPLNIAVTSSKSQLHQFHNSFLINIPKKHVSVSCSAKFTDSVKSFPWKKAEVVALEEFLVLGKETLKWSLLACYAFNFLSDILYSISINKELVIPLCLFVGIMTTKFLDEISRELMPDRQVTSIYVFGVNDFLLHVANGGLIQVLWNWKEIQKLDGQNLLQMVF